MKLRAVLAGGFCAGLLLLPAACGGGANAGRSDPGDTTAAAAADTARLGAIYTRIDSAFDTLVARYGPMASSLAPEDRGLFESMRQMHARTVDMHRMMMGGGMMGGGDMMGGRGMMGQGGTAGGTSLGALREWDQQMLAMHRAMGQRLERSGDPGLAAMHRRLADLYGQALQNTPRGEATAPERGGESVSGADVFARNCAACHGSEGRGVAGAFPPLAGSEWVADSPDAPIRILLHGLQGEIRVGGHDYDGVMPAFGARLTDRELAAVLSYVRSAWGNDAGPVDPDSVRAVRRADAGRSRAMSPQELH